MQQRVVDGAWRVQSLDDVYFFEGQFEHNQRAVISHKAVWANEISFVRDDVIRTEGNHWDGFSKGHDMETDHFGLYPSYKTEEIIKIGKMYTYPDVQVETD